MSIFKYNHFSAFMALLAYLVMTFNVVSGMVLCYEPDGRVILEMGTQGICEDAVQKKMSLISDATTITSVLQTGCDDCKDVPMRIESAEHQALNGIFHPVSIGTVQIAPAFVGIPSIFLSHQAQGKWPQPPPHFLSSKLEHLKTVILLI